MTTRDVLYIYDGPGTVSVQVQRNQFARAGFDKAEISAALIDKGDSRDMRAILLATQPRPMLSDATILRLACHAYIGKGGRDRAAVLRKLAALGCRVAVLDGDPVLYDNEDRIAEFNRLAATGAQREAGKATKGAGRGQGRPAALWPTRGEFRYILRQWRDERYSARALMDAVADMTAANGFAAPEFKSNAARWDAMRALFGNREDRDDREPPGRIKDQYPRST